MVNIFRFIFVFTSVLSLLMAPAHANVNSNGKLLNGNVSVVATHSMLASKSANAKQFIVQFEQKPMVTFKRELTEKSNRIKSVMTSAQKSQQYTRHANLILDNQQKFERNVQAKSRNTRVTKRFSRLLNAVALETELDIQSLKNIAGVKKVYPVKRYKKKLSNALPIIKADDAWQLLGGREEAGKGVRIAVIDSGIIPTHPMFDDANMVGPTSNDLPNDDYCRQEPSFCNNKLIVARHYVPSFVNITAQGEYDSPKALSGHGTHVAGIATGRQVTADDGDVISGVAPGAYLMVYKALWGQDGEGSDLELFSAIEDAYDDGADVINNSWGGENGQAPSSTIYQQIYQELEANGVVIVSAAGNEGEDLQGNPVERSIACPGCVEAGITVGATTTDLIYGLPIEYDGNVIYSQPSDSFSINTAITGQAQIAPSSNDLGCDAWDANALDGKIAVVNRGICFFEEKADLAEAAGAVGLIVINNVIEANITMAMGDATLPALLISKSDGLALTNYLEQNTATELQLATTLVVAAETARQDAIASFSSLGPNGDSSFIKPDISAPGVAILSATSPEDFSSLDQDYVRLNGTSMASPVVAGAAALLKQHEPNFSAKQIKNILINSSNPVVQNQIEERNATPFETGAGRLNVVNALNATAYAEIPNMAKQYCLLNCRLTNQLVSVTDETNVWQAQVEFDNSAITAQVFPNQITLSSTQPSASFEVQISVPRTFQTDWYFGRLIWTNSRGQTINQALAISNEMQVSELLQAELGEESDGKRQLTLVAKNISAEQDVDIALTLIGGAEFDEDSLDVTSSGTHSVDTLSANSIEVSAVLELGAAELEPNEAPVMVDLVADGIDPISCELDACDEVLYELDFDFDHYGTRYSQFMMSDNGFIIAGNNFPEGAELYLNKQFPNGPLPNNVIAPFWTDFDLINPTQPEDAGGGYMLVALYEEQGINYLVLQWSDVQLYTDTSVTPSVLGVSSADLQFSFQLILQENSENKWFRYLDIPEQPNFYSVGLENSSGTQGYTYWYDSAGESAVTTGESLALNLANVGELTLVADIDKVTNPEFANDDSYQVTAGVVSELNVLTNDLLSTEEATLQISVNDIEKVMDVFSYGDNVLIDQSSLSITSQPSNGVATVLANGLISYVANTEFSGQDSFTYQVQNSLMETATATVDLTVLAQVIIEPGFVLNLLGETEISSGQSQVYSAVASNQTGDLTYRWILPNELSSADTSSSSITVTAGSITQNTQVTLAVEVTETKSDGAVVIENAQIAIEIREDISVTEDESEDKGLFGLAINWYWLLMLGVFITAKRVRIKTKR